MSFFHSLARLATIGTIKTVRATQQAVIDAQAGYQDGLEEMRPVEAAPQLPAPQRKTRKTRRVAQA